MKNTRSTDNHDKFISVNSAILIEKDFHQKFSVNDIANSIKVIIEINSSGTNYSLIFGKPINELKGLALLNDENVKLYISNIFKIDCTHNDYAKRMMQLCQRYLKIAENEFSKSFFEVTIIKSVLMECDLPSRTILIDKSGNSKTAYNWIMLMLSDMPQEMINNLNAAQSHTEQRQILQCVFDKVNNMKKLVLTEAMKSCQENLIEIEHAKLVSKILMKKNYTGDEVLQLGNFAETSLNWANAYAKELVMTDDSDMDFDFDDLVNITEEVKSGEIMIDNHRFAHRKKQSPA